RQRDEHRAVPALGDPSDWLYRHRPRPCGRFFAHQLQHRGVDWLHERGQPPPEFCLRLHACRAGAERLRDVLPAPRAAQRGEPDHRLPAVLPGAPAAASLRPAAGTRVSDHIGTVRKSLMGWVNWTRKAAEQFGMAAAALGLDLNSTRLRAMSGETSRPPRPVPLDDALDELPLAVRLENSTPQIGRAAPPMVRR